MNKLFTPTPKPVHRSPLRLFFGQTFYRAKRRLLWLFSNFHFAKIRPEVQLSFEHFSHSTPLFRKLKDVDMYLQRNKAVNLKIAIKKLNAVVLLPGETFSYWKLIGKPTKRKGYLPGMILKSGSFTEGTGGGLCQLSNLIYWISLHSPLTVTERHRHSYDVFPDSNRTQPFGSGATCYYNYIDLMIRNDTSQPFQLFLELTECELRGAWKSDRPPEYRYEVYETEHMFKSEYWGGYTRHNVIAQKKYDLNGRVLEDIPIAENHAIMMYSPLIAQDETIC